MTLAEGVEFLCWAAERFDVGEACHCLTHPSESTPALVELFDRSAPVVLVQQALMTAEGPSAGLAPTVLIDLVDRPDLVDLKRVAALDSAGRATYQYSWHAVRRGGASFTILDMRIQTPARAELVIVFPTALDDVRRLLEAAAAVGWMTIASTDRQFVLLMASINVGLATCVNAGAAA